MRKGLEGGRAHAAPRSTPLTSRAGAMAGAARGRQDVICQTCLVAEVRPCGRPARHARTGRGGLPIAVTKRGRGQRAITGERKKEMGARPSRAGWQWLAVAAIWVRVGCRRQAALSWTKKSFFKFAGA